MDMSNFHRLEWVVSQRSHTINFLDLTITIENNTINTTLYEKIHNLYLYIPPQSAHPPGVLTGMIFGTVFRIMTLCLDKNDIRHKISTFFHRLLIRGYKRDNIIPLFKRALASKPVSRPPRNLDTSIFLHMKYHPNNPQSALLQQTFKECVGEPHFKKTLQDVANRTGQKCNISRMIIAYNRMHNIGNLLIETSIRTQALQFHPTSRIRYLEGPEREREGGRFGLGGFISIKKCRHPY